MSNTDKTINIILSLFLLIFFLFIHFYDAPDAVQHEKKLQSEFNKIQKLRLAKIIDYDSMHEVGGALVGAKYFTDANYSWIKKHYEQEFLKNGWVYEGEEDLAVWGDKIPGGKLVYYKKGKYRLTFQCQGEKLYRSFTYSISLSWDEVKYW